LREYREQAGRTIADAARLLDCDKSKISRIETGAEIPQLWEASLA
jgi:hypothetical protein